MTWYIEGSVSMGNLDVFKIDTVLGNYRVCMVECDDDTVSEHDIMTNARLIAAAPDLLAALETVIPDLEGNIDGALDGGADKMWIEGATNRLNAAHVAIAKAKGNPGKSREIQGKPGN